ncbi:hypothetical protein HDK64DRAFT_71101 [Phyllosticta capitalensis]
MIRPFRRLVFGLVLMFNPDFVRPLASLCFLSCCCFSFRRLAASIAFIGAVFARRGVDAPDTFASASLRAVFFAQRGVDAPDAYSTASLGPLVFVRRGVDAPDIFAPASLGIVVSARCGLDTLDSFAPASLGTVDSARRGADTLDSFTTASPGLLVFALRGVDAPGSFLFSFRHLVSSCLLFHLAVSSPVRSPLESTPIVSAWCCSSNSPGVDPGPSSADASALQSTSPFLLPLRLLLLSPSSGMVMQFQRPWC